QPTTTQVEAVGCLASRGRTKDIGVQTVNHILAILAVQDESSLAQDTQVMGDIASPSRNSAANSLTFRGAERRQSTMRRRSRSANALRKRAQALGLSESGMIQGPRLMLTLSLGVRTRPSEDVLR